MKYIVMAAIIAVCLLSVVAGVAKIMRTPQEVSFFAEAGLGIAPLILLGASQFLGGAICVFPKYRLLGLSLVTLGFLMSVFVIAMTGNIVFALISVLPALLSGSLALHERNRS